MRIGAYIRLFGRPGTDPPPPAWASIRDQALAAETAGFDLVVLEDAALYPGEAGDAGVWEAMTTAAAIAVATTGIEIGHAVINNPYRHPTLVARCAVTLDEISGGRYRLGIGLGNTPDDYPRFGIDAERRYSRFAEAIHVIHGLLRDGRASLDGQFYQVPDAELILRGPRPTGIPIIVAGGKPKMLGLAARYADEWNWWAVDEADGGLPELTRLSAEVDAACREIGREPASLGRSVDVFGIDAPARSLQASELAARLLPYREVGFAEVRCDVRPRRGESRADALAAMADVVQLLHEG